MMTLQEYVIEIKPTKIVRGTRLRKLTTEVKDSQVEEEKVRKIR
jgi:hypothetical protein